MDNAWIIAFYKETDPVIVNLIHLEKNYGLQDMENEHP